MKSIILMMSDSYGVYIPQNFIRDIDRDAWHVSPENAAILDTGPDVEYYWETWDDVLGSAYYVDGNNKYTLHQDGDLWALCPELMSNEEYENFFGEMKPAPDDAYEYEVCENCLIALANGDFTCMGDSEAVEVRTGLAHLHDAHLSVIPDGAEYGFSNDRCECCGALPGDRFRVICTGDK